MPDLYFTSPTNGRMDFNQVYEDIISYIDEDPKFKYKVIIGSDSHVRDDICFVTAIIVHRVGKGGRYYYRRVYQSKIRSLRQKIYTETALSLEVVDRMKQKIQENHHKDLDLEVHVDIGTHGETKELIKEVVGWVMGTGCRVKIKPNASGATKVADKYTK